MFNESVGLYYFSAVFQGNMSLLALVAVFLVFKLQYLSSTIQKNAEEILSYAKNHFASDPAIYKSHEIRIVGQEPEKVHNKIISLAKESKDININRSAQKLLEESNFTDLFLTRGLLLSKQFEYRTAFIKPFIALIIVIISSLLGLVFTYYLHINYPFIEIGVVLFTTVLNVFALFLNFKFIRQLLI